MIQFSVLLPTAILQHTIGHFTTGVVLRQVSLQAVAFKIPIYYTSGHFTTGTVAQDRFKSEFIN
jgi:hypothetical protein